MKGQTTFHLPSGGQTPPLAAFFSRFFVHAGESIHEDFFLPLPEQYTV